MKAKFTLALTLIMIISLAFQVTASQAAAGTYFTGTDNEDNAHTGTADGDMDVDIWNYYAQHPIEFNINIPQGGLPTTDAYLTIRAFDVDEEQGQKDQVFLNGTSLGFLSGTNQTWNTTAYAIPGGLLVEGNNLVQINVDTLNPSAAQWLVKIDWGQVVVDGGVGTPGRINSITVTGFSVVGGTITLDVDVVIEALADGTFALETNIYDPSSNNIGANTQTGIAMTAGQILTRQVQFVFPEGTTGDVYTIRGFLFDEATGLLNSIKSTTWTYNSNPVYDLDVIGTYNYFTNDPAMNIATGLTAISTPSGGTMDGAVVLIGNGFQAGDTLSATDSGGVTSSYNSSSGVLTLTGAADISIYQTVLGSVKFSTTSTNTTSRTVTYSLGAARPYDSNGHYYEYVSAPAGSWFNAQTGAASRTYFGRTGYLATITDANENAFATNKLGGAAAWIGGSDSPVEGEWRWVTGPEEGTLFCTDTLPGAGGCTDGGQYDNWASVQPDNASGEHYLQFLAGGTGQWNDLPGNYTGVAGYVVEYGGLGSDTPMDIDGSVTVNVTSNTAPVANNDSYSTPMGTTLSGTTVLVNDTDAESNPLTAIQVTGPSNASAFTLNSDGTFSYTPNNGFSGDDTFTYKANDGTADSNVATVTITVVNNAPTAVTLDNLFIQEERPAGWLIGNIGGTDTDLTDSLTYSLANTVSCDGTDNGY
ncbi:MAG: cadherin-like domain-containing protein, partial [Chloroflexi bacterium]|nr:cadherin-like domain-containing protein [Chloroflexota bacterium]